MTRAKKVHVFFEFKVWQDGHAVVYRGVRDRAGALRMEKRRANAIAFKPYLFVEELNKEEQMKNVLSRPCTALIVG